MTFTIEKKRQYQAKYLENNREKINLRKKARYYAHKERILAENKKRRDENKEHVLEIERASRAKNIKAVRASKILSQAKRNFNLINCKSYIIIEKDLKRLYSDPCYNCGSMQNQSIDHRIPISRGGDHGIGNFMTLCRSCNSSKKDKTITEWRKQKFHTGQK